MNLKAFLTTAALIIAASLFTGFLPLLGASDHTSGYVFGILVGWIIGNPFTKRKYTGKEVLAATTLTIDRTLKELANGADSLTITGLNNK